MATVDQVSLLLLRYLKQLVVLVQADELRGEAERVPLLSLTLPQLR